MTDVGKEDAQVSPEAEPELADATEDAPATVATGPRKRKQVDFFAPDDVKSPEKLVIKEGKGQKLGDIPNVAFRFQKITGRDELLEDIHMLLFKRKGKLNTRKREILGFSGYVYEGDGKDERAKLAEKLNKWKLEDIYRTMDLLDVPRGSGSKEAKANALLDFLEAPKVMKDVNLAEKAAKEKEKAKAKKEKAEAKREKAVAKKEKGEPPKKKPKKAEAAAARKAEPASQKKRKAPVKAAAKAARKRVEEEADEMEEDDSEDEAPLAAVAAAPDNDALRAEVLAILGTVQLEDFSLKDLLRRLEEKYKLSFRKRKDFIKGVVNKFIADQSTKGEDTGAEAEEPEQAATEEPDQARAEPVAAEPEAAAEVDEEAAEPPAEPAAAEKPEEAAGAAVEEPEQAHGPPAEEPPAAE